MNNNTMTISDKLNQKVIKDYETKLFKSYERVLKHNEKLFQDKSFELVMLKQRYDIQSESWINDMDEKFDNISYDNGYKCVVTFALYKNGTPFIVNGKKIMNSYYVVDISRRNQVDKKWVTKYFVLNPELNKDIEYFYVITSTV